MITARVDYRIIREPVRIELDCPVCDKRIVIRTKNLTQEVIWFGGFIAECEECRSQLELDDYSVIDKK